MPPYTPSCPALHDRRGDRGVCKPTTQPCPQVPHTRQAPSDPLIPCNCTILSHAIHYGDLTPQTRTVGDDAVTGPWGAERESVRGPSPPSPVQSPCHPSVGRRGPPGRLDPAICRVQPVGPHRLAHVRGDHHDRCHGCSIASNTHSGGIALTSRVTDHRRGGSDGSTNRHPGSDGGFFRDRGRYGDRIINSDRNHGGGCAGRDEVRIHSAVPNPCRRARWVGTVTTKARVHTTRRRAATQPSARERAIRLHRTGANLRSRACPRC